MATLDKPSRPITCHDWLPEARLADVHCAWVRLPGTIVAMQFQPSHAWANRVLASACSLLCFRSAGTDPDKQEAMETHKFILPSEAVCQENRRQRGQPTAAQRGVETGSEDKAPLHVAPPGALSPGSLQGPRSVRGKGRPYGAGAVETGRHIDIAPSSATPEEGISASD